MSEQRTPDPFGFFKPEPKKVLLIAWIDGDGELRTVTDPAAVPKEWKRVPELDKEITLP